MRIPFDELGYKCVFSSEWDKAAATSYQANFGECPAGDITQIDVADIPPHNLLLAGFPCQAFSIMGKREGFADIRGTMFFEIVRVLEHHRPQAILLENVKQLVTHDHGRTFATILQKLAELGYSVKYKVLNALDFGLPQRRERTIIVGFTDRRKSDALSLDFAPQPYNLADVLESDDVLPRSLWASERIVAQRKAQTNGKRIISPAIWHENKSGNVSVLDHACALRTGASHNYLLVNGYRRLSPREMLRLQGFPDSFRIVVSNAQLRRQAGNSVPVPMIRAVAKRIHLLLNPV